MPLTLSELIDALAGLEMGKVLIVGDVMLDHYIFGQVERISPEAPVPIVRAQRETHVLGGAANVAQNIASLGGVPTLIGYIGADASGSRLSSLLIKKEIPHFLQKFSTRPSICKSRIIAQQQQIVRVDHEESGRLSSSELDPIFEVIDRVISDHEVLIVSDYGKGLVQPEFMERLLELRALKSPNLKILIDPKTINCGCYAGVDMITPNTKEAAECAGAPMPADASAVRSYADAIFARLSCKSLLITLGAEGMALFEDSKTYWRIPTSAQKVYDVTGAGDTVIATMALCLAAGLPHLTSAILSNYAAGYVVGEIGAASVSLETLRALVKTLPLPDVVKLD